MKKLTLFTILSCSLLLASNLSALTNKGVSISLPLIDKDPANLHGFRTTIFAQPENWTWTNARIYLNAGFAHWWISGNKTNRSVNIYTIAPVLRFYLSQQSSFSTYIKMSIGASWISKTRFDDRNLGMHFAFQDELGAGVALGKNDRLSLTLSALHYSNGSLCNMNAGITIPLIFTVAIRLD